MPIDGIRGTIEQSTVLYRSLTPTQRAVVLLIPLAVLAGGVWLVWSTSGRPALVAIDGEFDAEQLSRVRHRLGAAGLNGFRVEGNRVFVPSDELPRYSRVLSPGDDDEAWTAEWERQIGRMGFFARKAQHDQARDLAQEKRISEMICAMPKIAYARVAGARPTKSTRHFGQEHPRVTATIGIGRQPGCQLSDDELDSLKKAVAGGVSDLASDDVYILDLSNHAAAARVAAVAPATDSKHGPDTAAAIAGSGRTLPWRWALAGAAGVLALLVLVVSFRGSSAGVERPPGEDHPRLSTVARLDHPVDVDGPRPPAEEEEEENQVVTGLPLPAAAPIEEREPVAAGTRPPAIHDSGPLVPLADVDPDRLQQCLWDEHPQAIALVISHLPPDRAGVVLGGLPPDVRDAVVTRLDDLQVPHADVLQQLADSLLDRLEQGPDEPTSLDARSDVEPLDADEQRMLETLDRVLNGFDELEEIETWQLRELYRRVDESRWAVALVGASASVRQTVLEGLPPIAARALQRGIDRLGPVRIGDIERAQRMIVEAAATGRPSSRSSRT